MSLTIGKLARLCGVHVETVRYYERVGLIARPLRPPAGHRIYPKSYIQTIRFIKRLQNVGFSLKDIALFVAEDGVDPERLSVILHKRSEQFGQQAEALRHRQELMQVLIHGQQDYADAGDNWRDIFEDQLQHLVGDDVINEVVLSQDISLALERVRLEEDLAQSKEKLAAIITALPNVTLILDEDGRYIDILTSEQDLLYKEFHELKGQLISDVFPQDKAAKFIDTIRKTIESGKPQVIEYELDVPAGRTWFEGRSALLGHTLDDKRVVIFLVIDITDRKKLQQIQVNAADALISEAAHHFEQLMESIDDNCQAAMQDQAPDSEIRRRIEAINGAVREVDEIKKTLMDTFLYRGREKDPS